MKAIIGDVLIDRVVTFGLLLAAVVGAGVAALAGLLTATGAAGANLSQGDVIGVCSLVGLVSAAISGGGVMGIMGSGTKAILMCWAEDPDRLHQEHGFEDLHAELNNKAPEQLEVLMLYYSRDRDEIFVRVAADPNHLRQVAEMIRYQLELKPQYLSAFADYKNDYPGRRDLNYSDRCIVSHLYETHYDKETEGENQQVWPPEEKSDKVAPLSIFESSDG
eukprot:s2587_g11.t1